MAEDVLDAAAAALPLDLPPRRSTGFANRVLATQMFGLATLQVRAAARTPRTVPDGVTVDLDALAVEYEFAGEVTELIEVGIEHRGRLTGCEPLRRVRAAVFELDGELCCRIGVGDVVVHGRLQGFDAETARRESDVAEVGIVDHRSRPRVAEVREASGVGSARVPREHTPPDGALVGQMRGVEPPADPAFGHVERPPRRFGFVGVVAESVVGVVFGEEWCVGDGVRGHGHAPGSM